MKGKCDICDKPAILDCPDCDLEVCKEHSRNGKCIYCTDWKADPKRIAQIERMFKDADEKLGMEMIGR